MLHIDGEPLDVASYHQLLKAQFREVEKSHPNARFYFPARSVISLPGLRAYDYECTYQFKMGQHQHLIRSHVSLYRLR